MIRRAYRVEHCSGEYSCRPHDGEVNRYLQDHWLFFTWSDGSISNYFTCYAGSMKAAIAKAKWFRNGAAPNAKCGTVWCPVHGCVGRC